MINHIQQLCCISSIESSVIIYEDNADYVAQIQIAYTKSNFTKYIFPKLLHLMSCNIVEINILQTKLYDSLIDLFTKYLPSLTFQKYIHGIGMQQFQDLKGPVGEFS